MISYYPLKVEALSDYNLLITFDNQEQRIFDVKPYLDDVYFAPLRDLVVFKSVKVNAISIEWNGDIDICPDELYYNSKRVSNDFRPK